MSRVILHVDMDYFYAACEERRNPGFKGKPLVVCVYSARGGGKGAVSTANYEARHLGVKSGMSCLEAKKLAPTGVFLPADFEFYEKVSQRIMEYLKNIGDTFEQIGLDEAFLDVTLKVGGSFEKARMLAEKIKRTIYEMEELTCSIGVAPSKLVAKIASDFDKPDGLTVVQPSRVEKFLDPLGVGSLWGVGRKTEEALEEMGIRTIRDLRRTDPGRLIERFGRSKGTWLYNASRGLDMSRVKSKKMVKQLSRITTLPKNTRDKMDIAASLKRLCRELCSSLIEENLSYKTVSFLAVTQDMKLHTKSRTLEFQTTDEKTIREIAVALMEEFLEETELSIRRVGVRVSGFQRIKNQKTLLDF